MAEVQVTLRRVDGGRDPFLPLLLEADESEPILRAYLSDGELYELTVGDEPVGAVLLIPAGTGAVEIKNIALAAEHRGHGVGRAAIRSIAEHARAHGTERLLVGTADAAPDTIAFYHACGFIDSGRLEGFFDRYPEPVVLDGVRAHDMVYFEMAL
jgi:GNAT superfamily N-acetyltransferase